MHFYDYFGWKSIITNKPNAIIQLLYIDIIENEIYKYNFFSDSKKIESNEEEREKNGKD